LRALVAAHPDGQSRAELAAALDGIAGIDARSSVRLYRWRNDLNRDLMALRSNPVQYQVYAVPDEDEAPELTELERREVLRPLSVFTLMGRTRAASHSDPRLREGWARYDSGDYLESVRTLTCLLPTVYRQGRMTIGELTLLFYYLAKALLKLNWYELLDELLSGPYLRLSTEIVNGDLEAERLQIMAISLRQRNRPADASACLHEAVRLLNQAVVQHRHPSIAMTLADTQVLLVQTSLDQALDPAQPVTMQHLRLREAHAALSKAKTHYEQWWSEAQTGEPVHYEGRLHGTAAFLTVARSIIEPDAISPEDWTRAEKNARMGYEPARYRKPFGIVAGRYAHAIVLLSKARWYELHPDHTPGPDERLAILRAGSRLLRDTRRKFLDTGEVILGTAYEGPKFHQALQLFNVLMSADPPSPPWPDHATVQLLTPLV
jgi:hypothetical protein